MLRNKFEIFVQVLEMAKNRASKTEIVSEINCSQELASCSLSLLMELGLLTETYNSAVSYKTTKRGSRFLMELSDLKKHIDYDAGSHEVI